MGKVLAVLGNISSGMRTPLAGKDWVPLIGFPSESK
jgi:hypothetical protein